MKTKKEYTIPCIDVIYLDNEISLILESTPPLGPDESFIDLNSNESVVNPFKMDLT